MNDPENIYDELKSTVSVRLLDPLGRSIEGLKYQVRQGQKIVAKGVTDSKGNITSFVSRIGTELSVHVEHFTTAEMKEVKKLIPWAENFRVRLLSGKVKEEVKARPDAGNPGPYRRKTHIVKSGDTLGNIASKYHTTAEAIAKLNHMKVDATIYEKQVLKVPSDDSGPAAPGLAPQAPTAVPPTSSSAPASTPPATPPGSSARDKPVAPNDADSSRSGASATDETAPVEDDSEDSDKPQESPMSGPVPTSQEEARGENGTPKATVNLKCDQSGCVKLGDQGFLVEEINLRLMGFGMTIEPPQEMDVFTEATGNAVRQFQRDYMGVPETGKVCGAVLIALDEFKAKYPISWAGMACPCGHCDGFGHGYTNSSSVGYGNHAGIEYPGMHRAVIWTFRAAKFYTSGKDQALGYRFHALSSGYRCWHRNQQTSRTSFNHMGNALDLQFTKVGVTGVCADGVLENLKNKVFVERMGAAKNWKRNMVSLEPISIAPRWVHFDVREFEPRYHQNRFYSKSRDGADGEDIVAIARREGRLGLVNCGGIPPRLPLAESPAGRKPFASLSLSKAGLDFIKDWEKLGPMSGLVTLPYDDEKHYCTVGYGHLLAKKRCAVLKREGNADFSVYEKGLTTEEALELLSDDVEKITSKASKFIHVPLYQYEYDALISLAFNTGGFTKFPKLIGMLNTGNYPKCCDEFGDITNGGSPGLVKRRKAEMDMFRDNHYYSKH